MCETPALTWLWHTHTHTHTHTHAYTHTHTHTVCDVEVKPVDRASQAACTLHVQYRCLIGFYKYVCVFYLDLWLWDGEVTASLLKINPLACAEIQTAPFLSLFSTSLTLLPHKCHLVCRAGKRKTHVLTEEDNQGDVSNTDTTRKLSPQEYAND